MRYHSPYRQKWGWIALVAMILAGCSPGYRVHRVKGVETLYHIDDSGDKRIIYVVDNDGILKVHDKNDPIIIQFLAEKGSDDDAAGFFKDTKFPKTFRKNVSDTQRLVRIGRIKAAKKRRGSDPIYVALHDTVLGPVISQRIGSVDKTQKRFRQCINEQMNADRVIHMASDSADVEIYFKSYFKKVSALNIKTHKLVPVNAFHFEAYVQSNYLTQDKRIIKGLGHWMDYREVIKETVQRVNEFIREQIGLNIPRDRKPFISPFPSRV